MGTLPLLPRSAPRNLPRGDRRQGRAWLAAVAYPLPDPWESEEQAARCNHRDLPGLSVAELHRERGQVRLRAILDPDPDEWLTERQQMIDRELARRDGGQRGR